MTSIHHFYLICPFWRKHSRRWQVLPGAIEWDEHHSKIVSNWFYICFSWGLESSWDPILVQSIDLQWAWNRASRLENCSCLNGDNGTIVELFLDIENYKALFFPHWVVSVRSEKRFDTRLQSSGFLKVFSVNTGMQKLKY